VVAGPYLLDTSTLIWAVGDPKRLSNTARRALARGPLVVSVVNYWGIVIKSRKGLLQIADPVSWWNRAVGYIGGAILSVRPAHISVLAALPDIHRDPFDRMLVAQSIAEGLAILSIDDQIGAYGVKVVW